MQQEIFDISDIPVFAYEPSVWAWLSLMLLIIIALAFSLLLRKRVGQIKLKIYDIAQREIKEINNSQRRDSHALSKFSLVIRRLLGTVLGVPVSSLSYQELKQLGDSLSEQAQKDLISILLKFENYKYSAQEVPAQEFSQALNSATVQIEALRLEQLARQ